MSREKNGTVAPEDTGDSLSRREFVALSAGIGLTMSIGAAQAESIPVTESKVLIETPDGKCDATVFEPAKGSYPGVLFWTDVFGMRPTTLDMGRRLASSGYVVLVPNPFYRVSKAPQFDDVRHFNFADKATRETRLEPLARSIMNQTACARDAVAYVSYLDSLASVDKNRKIGTNGYCMGGSLVLRSAAAVPERIGAVGSFHGGWLVTDQPDSPHLLAPKIKARVYIGIGSDDDRKQPDAKDKLRDAFAAAKAKAEIEVYPNSLHGWCIRDMPPNGDREIYNEADAEHSWQKLLALYKAALV